MLKRSALTLAALAAGLMAFASGGIGLSSSPQVADGADGLPRIASPLTPKTEKINSALGRVDSRLKKAIKDCGPMGTTMYFWERGVTAPMTGDGFLSLYVSDMYSCGGAHPNTYQMALTYDLSTGQPINWANYLPADLVEPSELQDASDGSKIGVVRAPALQAWYRAAVTQGAHDDPEWLEQCKPVFEEDIALVLWIDAENNGMAMQIVDLPHVVAACNETAVMPAAELRTRGAKPALVNAIEAAHKAKNWQ